MLFQRKYRIVNKNSCHKGLYFHIIYLNSFHLVSDDKLFLFSLPLKENSVLKDLLSQNDGAYGNSHPRFRWVRTLHAEKLKNALVSFKESKSLPGSVTVLERGVSGRVLALEILDKENELSIVYLKIDEALNKKSERLLNYY